MILLNQLSTEDSIIVTLNEKRTLPAPYYLFLFDNVTTREVVLLVIYSASDVSGYAERYNEFIIDTSTIFEGATPGQWNYFIYEQTSDSNTDETGLTLVEMGKMELKNITNTFSWN